MRLAKLHYRFEQVFVCLVTALHFWVSLFSWSIVNRRDSMYYEYSMHCAPLPNEFSSDDTFSLLGVIGWASDYVIASCNGCIPVSGQNAYEHNAYRQNAYDKIPTGQNAYRTKCLQTKCLLAKILPKQLIIKGEQILISVINIWI